MEKMLSTLLGYLEDTDVGASSVIPWSCPVPSFGDLGSSRVATLGLNPSNREFVDEAGNELDGSRRRFHTLKSLGLARWSDADEHHLGLISASCRMYFYKNPYEGWFRKLDRIISGTNASYYSAASDARNPTLFPDPTIRSENACHLDLIPYATACKWTELSNRQRSSLFAAAGDTLGLLLQDSPVRLIILNGQSVVEEFQNMAGILLDKQAMRNWTLHRRSDAQVLGYSYKGSVRNLAGVDIGRDILVLGYNHNIQSSFGVTRQVMDAIHQWIAESSKEVPL